MFNDYNAPFLEGLQALHIQKQTGDNADIPRFSVSEVIRAANCFHLDIGGGALVLGSLVEQGLVDVNTAVRGAMKHYSFALTPAGVNHQPTLLLTVD